MIRRLQVLVVLLAVVVGCQNEHASYVAQGVDQSQPVPKSTPAVVQIESIVKTDSVSTDADDPAIWVHPHDDSKSLIIGTDKASLPSGGLYVFDLSGKLKQHVPLNHANNVDVEYGFNLNGRNVDIVVATERHEQQLRIFMIQADTGTLFDITSIGNTKVFVGETGEANEPMGIATYKNSESGNVYAIVSRKSGPTDGYLHQYLLKSSMDGKVILEKVRSFGKFSGDDEIEAIAIDEEMGYVYYSDETFGVRKYYADPNHPEANKELATLTTDQKWDGDREGISIYITESRTGYIIVTDQIKGESIYRLYRREGSKKNKHDHSELVAEIFGKADDTDGIESTHLPLGDKFPKGALVVMNSKDRNFFIYDMREVLRAIK
jgi:3-phytase